MKGQEVYLLQILGETTPVPYQAHQAKSECTPHVRQLCWALSHTAVTSMVFFTPHVQNNEVSHFNPVPRPIPSFSMLHTAWR